MLHKRQKQSEGCRRLWLGLLGVCSSCTCRLYLDSMRWNTLCSEHCSLRADACAHGRGVGVKRVGVVVFRERYTILYRRRGKRITTVISRAHNTNEPYMIVASAETSLVLWNGKLERLLSRRLAFGIFNTVLDVYVEVVRLASKDLPGTRYILRAERLANKPIHGRWRMDCPPLLRHNFCRSCWTTRRSSGSRWRVRAP